MKCTKCHVEMQLGLAMMPVLGNSNAKPQLGQCMWPVGAALSNNCLKCPQCGHTVAWAGEAQVMVGDPHLTVNVGVAQN